MSSQRTVNYHLHQWTAWDEISRTEFNENFTVLDTVLSAMGKGGVKSAFGNYEGDKTFPRKFLLGFTPKVVIVTRYGRTHNSNHIYGGVAYKEIDAEVFHIVEGGFELLVGDLTWNKSNDYGGHSYAAFYWEE